MHHPRSGRRRVAVDLVDARRADGAGRDRSLCFWEAAVQSGGRSRLRRAPGIGGGAPRRPERVPVSAAGGRPARAAA